MNLDRIVTFFRSRTKHTNATPSPPDPAIEFPHPENVELFVRLREDAKVASPDKNPMWVMGGYEIRAHPDLISVLYPLVTEEGVRKGYAYGRPVMANANGLVFAYAGGTHYVFLKLREDKLNDARDDGGRFDPSYFPSQKYAF